MKFIFEEYGEVLLAIAGSVGVLSAGMVLFWTELASGVLYFARAV